MEAFNFSSVAALPIPQIEAIEETLLCFYRCSSFRPRSSPAQQALSEAKHEGAFMLLAMLPADADENENENANVVLRLNPQKRNSLNLHVSTKDDS